jgi:hypothetical protein
MKRFLYPIIFLMFFLIVQSSVAQSVSYTFEGFKTGCLKGDCKNGKGILAFAIIYADPVLENGKWRYHTDILTQIGYLAGEFDEQGKLVKGTMYSSLHSFPAIYTDNAAGTIIHLYKYLSDKKNNRGNVFFNDNLLGSALRYFNFDQEDTYYQFRGDIHFENLVSFYNQKMLTFSNGQVKSFFNEHFFPVEGTWKDNHADKTFEGVFHNGFPHRGIVKVNDGSAKYDWWVWQIADKKFTGFFGVFDYSYLNPQYRNARTFIPRRGKFTSTRTDTIVSGTFINDFSVINKCWKISPIGLLLQMDKNEKPFSIKMYATQERLFADENGQTEFIRLYDHSLPYVAQMVKVPGYSDSLWYEGQMKNNLPNGIGQLFYKRQLKSDSITTPEEFYWGFFKNGLPHGPGSLIVYPNIPNQLVGIYENGIMVYGDDGKYTGQFLAGKYHGKGQYKGRDNNLHGHVNYKGDFADGKFNGFGYWTIERYVMGKPVIDTYIGTFQNNKFDGKGIFSDASGTKNGLFSNGEFVSGTVTANPLLSLFVNQVVSYACGGASGKSYVQSVNTIKGTVTLGNGLELTKSCSFQVLNESSSQFFKSCPVCQGSGATYEVKKTFSGYYTKESTVYSGSTISGDYKKTTTTPIYDTYVDKTACSVCNGTGRVKK